MLFLRTTNAACRLWHFLPSLLLFLLFAHHQSTDGMKILVHSPTISRSHMISNARVADALAKDGHDVLLLEVEYLVPIGVFNASKVARTRHVRGPFYEPPAGAKPLDVVIVEQSFKPPTLFSFFMQATNFHGPMNEACENFILSQSALFEQLRQERFDLIISEQLNFCGAGLKHLLNIPTYVLLSSCSMQEHVTALLGLPFPSSYVPSVAESQLSDRMSLTERFWNLVNQLLGHVTFTHMGLDPLTGIYRRHFGPEFPDLRDIVKASPFVLVAVDELVDFPRPVFPNVVYIGGLGMESGNEEGSNTQLAEPFASEMLRGKNGIVYFSMGSIMKSTHMDEQFRRNLFKAFAQLPDYHFIVKIEKDDNFTRELIKNVPNVFITPWAPQTDLLRHPNLRLFITHGGYNSLMESARAGVPLISMGFFADQYRNARVAERNGWALTFEKRTLLHDSEQFREAIRKVIEDPKYTVNAKRTQKLLAHKPFSAEERLTKSIRYLEFTDGQLPELLSESRNMSTIALYNLDLCLLAFVAISAWLAFCGWLCLVAWRKFVVRNNFEMPKFVDNLLTFLYLLLKREKSAKKVE